MKVRDDWGLQMGYTAGQMDQKRIERTESLAFTLRFPVVLIGSPLCVIASSDVPQVSDATRIRVQRQLKSETLEGLFEFDVVNRALSTSTQRLLSRVS